MIGRHIKKNIESLEQVSNDWLLFHNFFFPQRLNREMENQFGELVSRLTNSHRILVSLLEFDIEIGQKIIDILGAFPDAKAITTKTAPSISKLTEEWNSVYLLIQETIGLLEYRLMEKQESLKPWNILKSIFVSKPGKKAPSTNNVYQISKSKNKNTSYILNFILTIVVLIVLVVILIYTGILQEYLP